MDVYDAIETRKSVRAYQNMEVPEAVLTRLLGAARLAPSANNFQEWRFDVVRDHVRRVQMAEAACWQSFFAEEPVVLACCAETNRHVMTCGQACYPIDVAIAVDHNSLCAAAEGHGDMLDRGLLRVRVKADLGHVT